jgi:hypothetical protein
MQGRLTLEKTKLYNAHFKWDIYIIRCQTVSHLSTVLTKPSIGAFWQDVQKAAEKSTVALPQKAKSTQKGRSNNKIALQGRRPLLLLPALVGGKPANDRNLTVSQVEFRERKHNPPTILEAA